MKKLLIGLLCMTMFMFSFPLYAQEVDFSIIPKSEGIKGNEIQSLAEGGQVRDKYNEEAGKLELADQINSGIMNRDTILDYIVYLARFIGELGLLIAAIVIIYIGYQKAMKVFNLGDSPIAKVIKGLIILIGAYFIVRFLYNAFIS